MKRNPSRSVSRNCSSGFGIAPRRHKRSCHDDHDGNNNNDDNDNDIGNDNDNAMATLPAPAPAPSSSLSPFSMAARRQSGAQPEESSSSSSPSPSPRPLLLLSRRRERAPLMGGGGGANGTTPPPSRTPSLQSTLAHVQEQQQQRGSGERNNDDSSSNTENGSAVIMTEATTTTPTTTPLAATTTISSILRQHEKKPNVTLPATLMQALQAVRSNCVHRPLGALSALQQLEDELKKMLTLSMQQSTQKNNYNNKRVTVEEPKLTLYAPPEITQMKPPDEMEQLEPEPQSQLQQDDDDTNNNNNNNTHTNTNNPFMNKNHMTADVTVNNILPMGVGMTTATYPANAPSEDRYTIAMHDTYLFAGVFDGHGGPAAAEFVSRHVLSHFQHALLVLLQQQPEQQPEQQQQQPQGGNDITTTTFHNSHNNNNNNQKNTSLIGQALIKAFQAVDAQYLDYARTFLQAQPRGQRDPSSLFCGTCALAVYVDFHTSTLTCANLGDSRAVLAVVENRNSANNDTNDQDDTAAAAAATAASKVKISDLSIDHTTDNASEQERLRQQHPHDTRLIVNIETDPSEPPDRRLKGITAFTRSLGDMHLKDKDAAALYNSYMQRTDPRKRILPRPGIKPTPTAERKTPPYLSNIPEITTIPIQEGSFVILACDGVWDEMTSEEAVQFCYNVIRQDDEANVADALVDYALEKAVTRLRETDPDHEGNLTLSELKSRPQGKAHDSHRSNLHDDITVVVLQFNGISTPEPKVSMSTSGGGNDRIDSASGFAGVTNAAATAAMDAEEEEEEEETKAKEHTAPHVSFDFDQTKTPTERGIPVQGVLRNNLTSRNEHSRTGVSRNWSNLSTFSRESLFSYDSTVLDEDASSRQLSSSVGHYSHNRDSVRDTLEMMMLDDADDEMNQETMGEVLTRLGRPHTIEKLTEIFNRLDIEGKGMIRVTDFEDWWQRKSRRTRAMALRRKQHQHGVAVDDIILESNENMTQQSTTEQILEMIEIFGGMTHRHLRILFDILDTNNRGVLAVNEIKLLLGKVLGDEPTELLVATVFAEMDEDLSGTVDFEEFNNFFGND